MTIRVATPDGGIAEFPDGTSPDVMRTALRAKFGGGPAKAVSEDMSSRAGGTIMSGLKNQGGMVGLAAQLAEASGVSGLVGKELRNAPSSAANLAKDIVQPVLHPIDTATNLGNIGKGVLQKLGIMSGEDATPYADAVGKFLMDRYGSGEAIKKTLATDPVGVAADLATVLSGGETALARLPGVAGKAGEIAGTVGRAVDPLSLVGAAVKGAGSAAAVPLGIHAGVAPESLRTAFSARQEGGAAQEALLGTMRGTTPARDVVEEARGAVNNLKQQRGAEYRKEMAKVGGDKTILDFTDIDKAVNNTVKTFKGQSIDPATEKIQSAIRESVEEWKALPAADFHTAEGLDALKQKIGSIRDATQYGTPERVAADKVYQAIRKTISDQVPEYGKIMKGYEEATATIKEIERELTGNPKAPIGPALRKITSALRNNVNTAFGNRRELVGFLARSGATHLLRKIAGHELSASAPRGLSRLLGQGEGAGALLSLAAGHPVVAAAAAASALASSPRVLGEAYGLAGAASRRLPLRKIGQASRLTGSATDQ